MEFYFVTIFSTQSKMYTILFVTCLAHLTIKQLLHKQGDSPKGIKDISEIDWAEGFILKSIIFF